MATKKFDKDQAIKNILGVEETEEKKSEKTSAQSSEKEEKEINDLIKIKPKRDKRVNYAITKVTYDKLQRKCKKLGVPVNEVVNQLLDNFVSDM